MLIEEGFAPERMLQTKSQCDPDDALGATEVHFLDRWLTVENHIHMCHNSSQVQYQHH